MSCVGLLKHYHTLLSSGSGRKTKALRREAAAAEAWVAERVSEAREARMSFVTDAEWSAQMLGLARRRWESCDACPLWEECRAPVYGDGVEHEPLLLVCGEAPGRVEDETGLAFRGPAGILLRRMCSAIGLQLPEWAFLTNSVLCRPPHNRRPDARERAACLPRWVEQVELLRPRVILLLGGTAGKWIGRDYVEVSSRRGLVPRSDWPSIPWEARRNLVAIFLTYHPSWVLRQDGRAAKRVAMAKLAADLRKVQRLCSLLDRKRREANMPAGGSE